ncbi:MAG: D-alanine--D-alanine ligase [Chlamydiae bacterium]|nr:D-alanine--D-alanine ligase [Chlamydiota bacterium]
MSKKIRVGILFGGKSSEHEISLLSAKNIFAALDKEKYEPVMIGIDKNGQWYIRDTNTFLSNPNDPKKICLHGDKKAVSFLPALKESALCSFLDKKILPCQIDVAFPIVHGTNGEDGSLQGMLKLWGIPFVGADILGSAVGMDKDVMKRLLRDAGISIGKFLAFNIHQRNDICFDSVINKLGLPIFVKPANNGSSIGVSKVNNLEEFHSALNLAFRYDIKILIEEFIPGREIECSVMGNESPIVSVPGEVIPSDDFHSWDAKYIDQKTTFHIPANLSDSQVIQVQNIAKQTYQILCCEGMARVDFFFTQDGQFLVNEINTLPGFTSTSAFPRLWMASGIQYTELVDKLIEYAIDRHKKLNKLATSAYLGTFENS